MTWARAGAHAREKEEKCKQRLNLENGGVVFAVRHGVDFEGPKIVCPQRAHENIFGYNENKWYASADVYFITDKTQHDSISLKYVLSLINSKLFFLRARKGKRKGDLLELYYKPLSEIPNKEITKDNHKSFVELVDKISSLTQRNDFLEDINSQVEV